MNRRLLMAVGGDQEFEPGQIAIVTVEPLLHDVVVASFILACEDYKTLLPFGMRSTSPAASDSFDIISRPRKGDLIRAGDAGRFAIRARRGGCLHAALFVKIYDSLYYGVASCDGCKRTFYTDDRYDLSHECENIPRSWEEAIAALENKS